MLQFQAFRRIINDTTAHANSNKPLATKAEPALQLSPSQQKISHVTECEPDASLQMGLFFFWHAALGEQPLK